VLRAHAASFVSYYACLPFSPFVSIIDTWGERCESSPDTLSLLLSVSVTPLCTYFRVTLQQDAFLWLIEHGFATTLPCVFPTDEWVFHIFLPYAVKKFVAGFRVEGISVISSWLAVPPPLAFDDISKSFCFGIYVSAYQRFGVCGDTEHPRLFRRDRRCHTNILSFEESP